MQVFINGRFLSQRVTGVQRYAHETLLAMDTLLAQRQPDSARRFTLLAPPGTVAPTLRAIDFKTVGPFAGHAWEQLVLPLAARGGWLLSFGPTGPLVKRGQLVTIHDAAVHAVPEAFSRKFRVLYKLLLPALVRRTELVMTVSDFSRSEIVRHFGGQNERLRVSGEGWQHVGRFGSDVSILERNALRSRGYVLAVSSITPHKNFKLIAQAVAKLGVADFDIAVAGAVDARIFGALGPNALGSVKLLGYVNDAELRALYEHAAAFVYPSFYEGFGIPPLEAMALGCPVLASRAASIPEVCGDAAWYFSPHDADELSSLMQRLVADPSARSLLIEKGRERLAQYSWEAAARCHLEALDELAA